MPDILTKILHTVGARSYVPLKPKPLFKRLNLPQSDYPEFRKTVRELIRTGRLVMARNNTLRAAEAHATLTGTFRRATSGHGFVRPHAVDGTFQPEVFIREVLAALEPLANRMREAETTLRIGFGVSVVTYMSGTIERDPDGRVGANVPTPALHLSVETIGRLAALRCSVDCDMYVDADQPSGA